MHKSLYLVLALTGLAQAEKQDVKSSQELVLTLSPSRKSYVQLEPVRFRLSLENRSGTEVILPFDPFGRTALQVLIAAGKGEFAPFYLATIPPGVPPAGAKKVPHGWKDQSYVTVFYKTVVPGKETVRVLDNPGQYRCKVKLPYQGGTVTSDEVEFHIMAPTGGDVEAEKYLRSNDLDKFLTDESGVHIIDASTMDKIETFYKLYPGCTYEKYLYFGIGAIFYNSSLPQGDQKDFNEGDLRKAQAWCGKACSIPDHPYRIDAAFYAGRASQCLKETKIARAYMNMVMESGTEKQKEEAKRTLRGIETLEAAGLNR